jgi:magnesium-transporting ATPase (P-type)
VCALALIIGVHRFAGFIEFESSTRADSAAVVAELRSSGSIAVTMVTGDSVLTAAHVAVQVGILGDSPGVQQVEVGSDRLSSKKLKRVKRGTPLLLRLNSATSKLEWVPVWDDAYNNSSSTVNSSATATVTASNTTTAGADAGAATGAAESETLTTSSTHSKSSKTKRSSSTSSRSSASGSENSSKLPRPFRAAEIERLSRRHDLCVTGDALQAALQSAPELVRAQLHAVRIFARMTPAQKETVATAIKVSSYCCTTVTTHACAICTAAAATALQLINYF